MTIWEMWKAFIWWITTSLREVQEQEEVEKIEEQPFVTRLAQLGAVRQKQQAEDEAREKRYARERIVVSERGERKLREYVEFGNSNLAPILEWVQRIYVPEGELTISRDHSLSYPWMGELLWDCRSRDLGLEVLNSGHELRLVLKESKICVYVGGRMIYEREMDRENWEQEVMGQILSAIESGKTHYERSRYVGY